MKNSFECFPHDCFSSAKRAPITFLQLCRCGCFCGCFCAKLLNLCAADWGSLRCCTSEHEQCAYLWWSGGHRRADHWWQLLPPNRPPRVPPEAARSRSRRRQAVRRRAGAQKPPRPALPGQAPTLLQPARQEQDRTNVIYASVAPIQIADDFFFLPWLRRHTRTWQNNGTLGQTSFYYEWIMCICLLHVCFHLGVCVCVCVCVCKTSASKELAEHKAKINKKTRGHMLKSGWMSRLEGIRAERPGQRGGREEVIPQSWKHAQLCMCVSMCVCVCVCVCVCCTELGVLTESRQSPPHTAERIAHC